MTDAEAQDVGHLHDVLAQSRRVYGRQQSCPAERLCSWRAPLPAVGSVRVDPVEHRGAQTLDLAQAPLQVPSWLFSSTGPASRGTSRKRCSRRGPCGSSKPLPLGSSSTSAAAEVAARGLLVRASSSCVSNRSMASPGRPPYQALQADTMRKLVVVEDVLLRRAFPELLPAGPTERLSPCTCMVANSDQQTGRWRPARPARRRAKH